MTAGQREALVKVHAMTLHAGSVVLPWPAHTCGQSARKRVEVVNTKGTQDRSPKDSMKPKPSVVMSMVVRIAPSFHSASTT